MILILFSAFVTSVLCSGPTVTLPEGKIEGLVATTVRNKTEFYAYLGIPFAAPPVGELRFKPPQPVRNWNGTFLANSNTKICYQISPKIHYAQYEDCLILNVYTPVKPGSTRKLPVMVSIYGGSFTHGYARFGTAGRDYFIEADIIEVTFNYRVGPFGFLSTGDEVIPGNMGLKDQLFALKWVQRNIHLFGGDPDRVTIQGQSAGAASVTYHILSPESKGLFRAAIANSGSALDDWANRNSSALHIARGIAHIINNTISKEKASSQEIYDLLMKVDAASIHATSSSYKDFAPVVEVKHNESFITESMYELVRTGKFNRVPLMIGFNSEEYISLAGDKHSLMALGKKIDSSITSLVPGSMNANKTQLAKIGALVKNVYTGGADFKENLGAAIRFRSDDSFIRGVIRYAQLQAQYSDVYLYQFSYHGILGGNNLTYEGCGRVEHGEDSKYLYVEDPSRYPESDIKTLERYVGFFTNFIKTMDPTPAHEELFQNLKWPNLKPEEINYLDIDKDLTIQTNPRNGTFEKWVNIYNEYAQEPLLYY